MQTISVITVVYNGIRNIERTILNVLKQTYPNIEYIVVDGGSRDGTIDVIRKYESRLKWISEPDNGIYDAMMKGARIAIGEWIIFRNCGDYFFNQSSIMDVYSRIGEKCNDDFILTNARIFKDWGYIDAKPPILEKNYFIQMPVLHPSTFIKRTTQLKYPFHLEYRNSADYYFFIEAFKDGASYCYFDIITSLVDSRDGATADHYDRSVRENIEILKKLGAPQERVDQLKKSLKKMLIKTKMINLCPFYSQYDRMKKLKSGWKKESIDKILENIN